MNITGKSGRCTMNIENRLNELTQETLNFADVINSTDNPANSDFRNACNLFSQYLDSQLQLINTSPIEHNSFTNVQNITSLLGKLSGLIAPNHLTFNPTQNGPDTLVDFCKQLKLLKSYAA